jgi:hypothetical protein
VFSCPHCGAEVPANAKACPGCGADERTAWSEEAEQQGSEYPEEDFNYEDFVRKEFGNRPVPRGISWFWWVVAVLVLAAMLWLWVK